MRFALSFVLAALCLAPIADAQDSKTSSAPLLSIEQVQELPWNTPVYGYSTLDPTGPKKFTGRFLDVLHGTVGLGHDWIVIELNGEPFDGGGIFAGQSGSPVFTDIGGKPYKIGTVSYAESWTRNPICYLTPIHEVLAAEHGVMRALSGVSSASGAHVQQLLEEFAHGTMVDSVSSGVSVDGAATPIVPGSVLGVQLAWGDFDATAFGTVSHVAGDQIFMFGHPFLKLGPVEYRLVQARVMAVQRSYQRSAILAAPIRGLPPVGVITQDRETGVFGTLGKEPVSAIPVTVTATSELGTRTFNFSTITHPFVTPLIIAAGVREIIAPSLLENGEVTIFMNGTIELDGGDMPLVGRFASAKETADEIGEAVSTLLKSGFKPAHIKKISVDLRMYEESRVYSVRLLSFDGGATVRPGEFLSVRVILSRPDGKLQEYLYSLPIPNDSRRGNGRVIVSGQKTLADAQRELNTPGDLETVTKMAASRTPDALYVYLILPSGQVRADRFPFADFVIVGKRELEFSITK